MRFPGGKKLHAWDLTSDRVSVDDLLRSCQQVGLTGFAELRSAAGAGMILYYQGTEVSALYREGATTYHGQEARQQLRSSMRGEQGTISVFELPLEMAHLLRGITNRRRLPARLRNPADLQKQLEEMKIGEHTGMLEVHTDRGSATVLFVAGRICSLYWDAGDGIALEREAALAGLQQALRGGEPAAFISDFSRDVWKSRHEVQDAKLRTGALAGDPAGDDPADRQAALRRDALEELDQQIPALVQGLVFDLLTGAVLARRIRSTAALKAALIADKLPDLTRHAREILWAEGDHELEVIELSTNRLTALVVVVPETLEAVAAIADKAQPTAHVAAILGRTAQAYAVAVRGRR
jgi:hypothetical protein